MQPFSRDSRRNHTHLKDALIIIITVAPAPIKYHSTVTIDRQRPAAIISLPAPAEPAQEKLYSSTIRNRIGTAPKPQDAASRLQDVTT